MVAKSKRVRNEAIQTQSAHNSRVTPTVPFFNRGHRSVRIDIILPASETSHFVLQAERLYVYVGRVYLCKVPWALELTLLRTRTLDSGPIPNPWTMSKRRQ